MPDVGIWSFYSSPESTICREEEAQLAVEGESFAIESALTVLESAAIRLEVEGPIGCDGRSELSRFAAEREGSDI